MSLSRGRRRLGVAGALSALLVLAPFLCLRNPTTPRGDKVLAVARTSRTDLAIGRRVTPRASRSMLAPRSGESVVLAAPPVPPPPTTAAPAPVRRVEAAVARPRALRPTTTTAVAPKPVAKAAPPKPPPPTTTTSPPPPPPAHTQTGEASWYSGPDGECANNEAPMGAVIRVTNLANGKSTTCRVTSRGPYGGGRIVDLTKTTFARIADPAAGVFRARVEW